MSIEKFESGEPFPLRLPRGQEGLFPMLAGESLLVAITLSEVSNADAHKITKKSFQIGALSFRSVPFIIAQFKGFGTLDGYLNPFQYNQKQRRRFLHSEANALHFCLTEGPKHIIRGQRFVGAEPELMAHIRSAYQKCIDEYDDGIAVNRQVREAYQIWDLPEDMLKDAEHTQVFH